MQSDCGSAQLQLPPYPSCTDGDVLCLPGGIVSAPGPVLVPTLLQTELVLRCHKETDCDLCVRVAVHLAVHGEPMGGMGMGTRVCIRHSQASSAFS